MFFTLVILLFVIKFANFCKDDSLIGAPPLLADIISPLFYCWGRHLFIFSSPLQLQNKSLFYESSLASF